MNIKVRKMQTRLTLKPGQNGTKKWLEKYGDKLVTVRYRYDEENKKRFKTVELIVEESHWTPTGKAVMDMRDRLGIQVAGYETSIRNEVKRAGGIWRPRQKLWELSYSQILRLGLESRIVSVDEK